MLLFTINPPSCLNNVQSIYSTHINRHLYHFTFKVPCIMIKVYIIYKVSLEQPTLKYLGKGYVKVKSSAISKMVLAIQIWSASQKCLMQLEKLMHQINLDQKGVIYKNLKNIWFVSFLWGSVICWHLQYW